MKRTHDAEARRRALLGLGLDNEDGHKRVTRGENFLLLGGSENTHGEMQEKALKFNEELKKRGQRMEDLSREEFGEIAERLDMPTLTPPPQGE